MLSKRSICYFSSVIFVVVVVVVVAIVVVVVLLFFVAFSTCLVFLVLTRSFHTVNSDCKQILYIFYNSDIMIC